MADSPIFVLVDGSSYLFRAFHAMPSFTNSEGVPTGAILGVVNMLRRLRADFPSEYFAVVFDAPGKTFRDDWYPQYKANRPPMPGELREQIEPLHQLIGALGLPLLCVPGVEADDVIGTLAERGRERGFRVVISTNDKDMAQLVDAWITLVNTMDDSILDEAGVEARFGVPPGRIVDYLTLVGDTVDNVPGVPKVGPKTAVKWLAAYGSLDGVRANAEAIAGKAGENLRAFMAPNGAAESPMDLSRRLVTIRRDVGIEKGPEELRPGLPDRGALETLYGRLQFRSLLRELLDEPGRNGDAAGPEDGPTPAPASAVAYETVLTEDAFRRWMERIASAEVFAVDTETTSLDYMDAQVVGVAVAVAPGEGAYIPFAHRYPGAPNQLGEERVLGALRPILEDPQRPKIGHNLKYDMSVLANHGIAMAGIAHDTMLQSYVLDSTATRHDMDSLATRYLGVKTRKYEEVAGKGAKQITFDQVDLDEAGPYAAEDAEVTLGLHSFFTPKLSEHPGLERVYAEIEMPLVPVLSAMERRGVRVDVERLEVLSEELAERMASLEGEAHEAAGGPFNLQSAQADPGDPVRRGSPRAAGPEPGPRPASRRPRTGCSRTLPGSSRCRASSSTTRALSKLRSTYTVALRESVNRTTDGVHTSYHQAVASTGRLSSSAPNLQNIPVAHGRGAGASARRSSRRPDSGSSPRTTRRSSFASWPTLSGDEGLVGCVRGRARHPPGRPRRRWGARRRRTWTARCAGAPRRSTSASSTECRHSASRASSGSSEGRRKPTSTAISSAIRGCGRTWSRPGPAHATGATWETVFGRRLYLPEDQVPQRRPPAVRGTHRDQRSDAGHRGRRHQAGDGVPARMHGRPRARGADDHAGARRARVPKSRRTRCWRWRTRSRSAWVRAADELADRIGIGRLRVPLEVEAGNGINWDEAH